jgi:hypothetical protein
MLHPVRSVSGAIVMIDLISVIYNDCVTSAITTSIITSMITSMVIPVIVTINANG